MKKQGNKTKVTLEEARKMKGRSNLPKLLAEQQKEKNKRQ